MIPRVLIGLALLLAGCGDGSTSGPVEPVWDRDACEHCRMTVSDRHFAAQVRSALDGKVRHFDDPGCAALWGPKPEDEIWVRDATGDAWLDARSVRFESGHKTPMGYGYGASADARAGLTWPSMAAKIQERERERREHPQH